MIGIYALALINGVLRIELRGRGHDLSAAQPPWTAYFNLVISGGMAINTQIVPEVVYAEVVT